MSGFASPSSDRTSARDSRSAANRPLQVTHTTSCGSIARMPATIGAKCSARCDGRPSAVTGVDVDDRRAVRAAALDVRRGSPSVEIGTCGVISFVGTMPVGREVDDQRRAELTAGVKPTVPRLGAPVAGGRGGADERQRGPLAELAARPLVQALLARERGGDRVGLGAQQAADDRARAAARPAKPVARDVGQQRAQQVRDDGRRARRRPRRRAAGRRGARRSSRRWPARSRARRRPPRARGRCR